MEAHKLLETAVTLLADVTIEKTEPEENRVDLVVTADNVVGAIEKILDTEWGYLASITGLDPSIDDPNLEVLYQICSGPVVLTLRVPVSKENAFVPTLCDLLPSASFFERELIEMFGIKVPGTPDPSRLFLPDEWPDDVYPLLKSFQTG